MRRSTRVRPLKTAGLSQFARMKPLHGVLQKPEEVARFFGRDKVLGRKVSFLLSIGVPKELVFRFLSEAHFSIHRPDYPDHPEYRLKYKDALYHVNYPYTLAVKLIKVNSKITPDELNKFLRNSYNIGTYLEIFELADKISAVRGDSAKLWAILTHGHGPSYALAGLRVHPKSPVRNQYYMPGSDRKQLGG